MTPTAIAPEKKTPDNVLIRVEEPTVPETVIIDGADPDVITGGKSMKNWWRDLLGDATKPRPEDSTEQTTAKTWFSKMVNAVGESLPDEKPNGAQPYVFNLAGGPREEPEIPAWIRHAINSDTKDNFAKAASGEKSFAAGAAALKIGKAALLLFRGVDVDVSRDKETGDLTVSGKVKAGIANHVWSLGVSWKKGKVKFQVQKEGKDAPKTQ